MCLYVIFLVVQVLHNLSLWSASDEPDAPLKMDVAMEAARNAKKHMKMVGYCMIMEYPPRLNMVSTIHLLWCILYLESIQRGTYSIQPSGGRERAESHREI